MDDQFADNLIPDPFLDFNQPWDGWEPNDEILDELHDGYEDSVGPVGSWATSPLAETGAPLHDMMDRLESDIEQQDGSPNELETSPDIVLEDIEENIEEQYIHHENIRRPAEPIDSENSLAQKESSEVTGYCGKGSDSHIPSIDGVSPIREYPYPQRTNRGGSSGIRNQGSGMRFCTLYDMWVTTEECEDCNDFEPGDTDEDICKYAG